MIVSGLLSEELWGNPVLELNYKNLNEIKKAKLVVLFGGEDISPQLYGEKPVYTHAKEPTYRDKLESKIIDIATEEKIPILGLCRGAQLLCVKNGGSLWQHVDNHCQTHNIILKSGEEITTNSLHHQMMIPENGEVLAVSSKILSPIKYSEKGELLSTESEPEIVLFENGLGVQGHPEWMPPNARLVQVTKMYLESHFGVNL